MRKKGLCVGFGAKVSPIRMLLPGRVLLHEGEVWMVENKKKRKVCGLLIGRIVE